MASPGRLYSTSCHCIFFTHATLDRQEPPPAFNIAKRPYQTSALELLPDLNPDRSLVYQSELVSRAASSVHSKIFLGASWDALKVNVHALMLTLLAHLAC